MKSKRVYLIDEEDKTWVSYSSMTDAGKSLGVGAPVISTALKEGGKVLDKYSVTYAKPRDLPQRSRPAAPAKVNPIQVELKSAEFYEAQNKAIMRVRAIPGSEKHPPCKEAQRLITEYNRQAAERWPDYQRKGIMGAFISSLDLGAQYFNGGAVIPESLLPDYNPMEQEKKFL